MGIRCLRRKIEGPAGEMTVLILAPKTPAKPAPGVLWIHGGGYFLGMAAMIHFSRARALAAKYGAVVISPEYRLAGEAPYPAALKDCYAALLYLKEHAAELGARDDQLFVGGESAGGGLTAALCMYARDRGEVSIAYQMPLYPMLDCRDTDSSRDNHGHVWNTRKNHAGWRKYLGEALYESDAVPAYASPARQTDYTGLPPAYTFVCRGEPFYDETLAYVENLRRAGVEADVDVYPGKTHAFDMLLPWKAASRQAIKTFERHYRHAAEHHRAAQPAGEK